jgi:hypothetical protein
MRTWPICVLTCVAALPTVCQPAPVRTGIVVDDRGSGAANITIAQFWLAGSHTPSGSRAYDAAGSDANGKFQIKPDHFPTTLFALDSEGKWGAIVVVSETAEDIRIPLQPLWRVHYRFEGTGLTDLAQSRITLARLSQLVSEMGLKHRSGKHKPCRINKTFSESLVVQTTTVRLTRSGPSASDCKTAG